MSQAQLNYLRATVSRPVHVVKKEWEDSPVYRLGSSSGIINQPTVIGVLVDERNEQLTTVARTSCYQIPTALYRVYVNSPGGDQYKDVGWVMWGDCENCMICRCQLTFGSIFTYFNTADSAHHCRACGNLVCEACSPNRVRIAETSTMVGPQRVCNICYYGQEVVHIAPNRPRTVAELERLRLQREFQVRQLAAAAALTGGGKVDVEQLTKHVESTLEFNAVVANVESQKAAIASAAKETPEEAARRKKTEEQARFQQEALKRFQQQTPSLARSLQRNDSGTTSAMTSVDGGSSSFGRISSTNSAGSAPSSYSAPSSLSVPPTESLKTRTSSETPSTDVSPTLSVNATQPKQSVSTTHPVTTINTTLPVSSVNTIPPVAPAIPSNTTVLTQSEADRRRGLEKFGPLTVVVPTPAMVIKLKRRNGVKVFVNILTHPQVLFRQEGEGESNALDLHKELYFSISPPFEFESDKDRTASIIYDVVVHPDEFYIVSIDPTGAARTRLCQQVITALQNLCDETTEDGFIVLRLNSNYKGLTDTGSVRPYYLPHEAAFFSCKQLVTVNVPHTVATEATRSAAIAATVVTPPSGSSTMTRRASAVKSSIAGAIKSVTNIGTAPLLATEKSILRAVVIDSSRFKSLNMRSIDSVHNLLSTHEVPLRSLILHPRTGFVIKTRRIKPQCVIYLNVCHHQQVGSLSVAAAGTQAVSDAIALAAEDIPLQSIPNPCPLILGGVREPTNAIPGGGNALLIDVVVPSKVMLLTIADPTGDMRESLTQQILRIMGNEGVVLDSAYSLPVLPGGYVPDDLASENVTPPPVLNVLESDKDKMSVLFCGQFFKQGHRVKSWKERRFVISENKIHYFDDKGSIAGDTTVEGCTVEVVSEDICSPPPNTWPFVIRSVVTGGEFLYCTCADESLRTSLMQILSLRSEASVSREKLANAPPIHTGWMRKQGSFVKSWKSRFFVLHHGVLQYFETNGQERNGVAESPLGTIPLVGASVTVIMIDDNGKKLEKEFRICISHGSKKLLLSMKTGEEQREWFESILRHIEFADK